MSLFWDTKELKELSLELSVLKVDREDPFYDTNMPKTISALVNGEWLLREINGNGDHQSFNPILYRVPFLSKFFLRWYCHLFLWDLYTYMYELTFEDLLVHINSENVGIKIVVQWRFRMGR